MQAITIWSMRAKNIKVDFALFCRVCSSHPVDCSRVCEERVRSGRRGWQVGLWDHPVGDLLRWRGPTQGEETYRGGRLWRKWWLYNHTYRGNTILSNLKWQFCLFAHFVFTFLSLPFHHQASLIPYTLCYVSVLSRRRGFTRPSASWPPQTAKSWLNSWPTAWTTTPRRDPSSGPSSGT